jgi:hypothetical protein
MAFYNLTRFIKRMIYVFFGFRFLCCKLKGQFGSQYKRLVKVKGKDSGEGS